jgi:hypothetical protein
MASDKPYATAVHVAGTLNTDQVQTLVGFCDRLIANKAHAVLMTPAEVPALLDSIKALKQLLLEYRVSSH